MDENIVGNVTFVSNLQPVEGYFYDDKNFLSKIKDPFVLTDLKNDYRVEFTQEQLDIFYKAGAACAWAIKGDFPWGSVIDDNGYEKVVCKCENRKCEYFFDCRSDLTE